MDILELESIISKIKHSLDGINSRLDTVQKGQWTWRSSETNQSEEEFEKKKKRLKN